MSITQKTTDKQPYRKPYSQFHIKNPTCPLNLHVYFENFNTTPGRFVFAILIRRGRGHGRGEHGTGRVFTAEADLQKAGARIQDDHILLIHGAFQLQSLERLGKGHTAGWKVGFWRKMVAFFWKLHFKVGETETTYFFNKLEKQHFKLLRFEKPKETPVTQMRQEAAAPLHLGTSQY